MSDIMEEYHQEEDRCRKVIQKRAPDHPILKKFFSSTYIAVNEFWAVIKELDDKEDDKTCK